MYRQGDVLIEKVEGSLPKNAEEVKPDSKGRLILAEGEATGHAHAISAGVASMFLAEQMMILQVFQQGQVEHEEHGFIDLDPGLYKISRQREYTPERIQFVAD